jgi:hypothetical protein
VKIEKSNSALAGGICPNHFAHRIYLDPRMAKFKTHAHPLVQSKRSNCLNGNAFAVQIANNTAIGFVESHIRQSVKVLPVLATGSTRGS